VSGFRAGGFGGHSYAASKAAVTQLTRSVAAEIGKHGIRVNSISPGAIVTGIFAKNAGVEGSKADRVLDVVAEKFATMQPVPRAGRTDDVANAAAFLASDKGSFIHGQDIVIDGGISLAGLGWKEGIEFRADMMGRINRAVEGLND
jgi:NAD(P)-dependent dehydrogenase (short-subunit alcohol dehydrogenase family)